MKTKIYLNNYDIVIVQYPLKTTANPSILNGEKYRKTKYIDSFPDLLQLVNIPKITNLITKKIVSLN